MIACDGVRYGGRDFDRIEVVAQLRESLPSVQHLIVHRNPGASGQSVDRLAPFASLNQATARDDADTAAFEPLWLPFDHPLWIVYSSGTVKDGSLDLCISSSHGATSRLEIVNENESNVR